MTDLITTLGLLKTTSDVIRDAVQIAREAKRTDLADKLFDVYQRMTEMLEENRELHGEIVALREAKRINEALIPKINEYWLPKGNAEDGPFCTVCWDVDSKLVRLHRGYVMETEYYSCPYCTRSRGK